MSDALTTHTNVEKQ